MYLGVFWPAEYVFEDYLGVRRYADAQEKTYSRIRVYQEFFRLSEYVFEDYFGVRRYADAKGTINLQILIYLLHEKKDSQENHVLKIRSDQCLAPLIAE